MRIVRKIIIISLAITLSGCLNLKLPYINSSAHNFNITSKFYDSIVVDDPNIAQLNLFFATMPKGGDLHHHYSGSIYAETYLDFVNKKNWLIDECTLKIVTEKQKGDCNSLTVDQLLKDDTLYRKLLTFWSNKDYKNHFHAQPAPDSNFFNTFNYFKAVSHEYVKEGLNILKERALKENVSYIETMLSRVEAKPSDYFNSKDLTSLNNLLRNAKSQQEVNLLLNQITTILVNNKKFNTLIDKFVENIKTNHRNIDDDNFVMRYQTFAVRILNPVHVFIDLLAGYIAVEKSPLIVGVNIVAPENNVTALSDYSLHMQMYNYLLNKYPNVKRSLHAGELTLGMVRPKDLTFHIKQARDIAKAQRIGHGIDLPYEQHSLELLKDLKEHAAIEINLSSNEFILGVSEKSHPYLIYANYGVPIVISTDDSGVSRNNLTNEYVLLASRYKPTYKQIKTYVYNSIKYSFLQANEKIIIKNLLDKKFLDFEQKMTNLYNNMK